MAEEGHPLQPPLGKLIKPSISTALPLSVMKGTQGLAALPNQELITYPVMNSAEKQPELPADPTCLPGLPASPPTGRRK